MEMLKMFRRKTPEEIDLEQELKKNREQREQDEKALRKKQDPTATQDDKKSFFTSGKIKATAIATGLVTAGSVVGVKMAKSGKEEMPTTPAPKAEQKMNIEKDFSKPEVVDVSKLLDERLKTERELNEKRRLEEKTEADKKLAEMQAQFEKEKAERNTAFSNQLEQIKKEHSTSNTPTVTPKTPEEIHQEKIEKIKEKIEKGEQTTSDEDRLWNFELMKPRIKPKPAGINQTQERRSSQMATELERQQKEELRIKSEINKKTQASSASRISEKEVQYGGSAGHVAPGRTPVQVEKGTIREDEYGGVKPRIIPGQFNPTIPGQFREDVFGGNSGGSYRRPGWGEPARPSSRYFTGNVASSIEENPFHLSPDMLDKAEDMYDKELTKIFPDKKEVKKWEKVKGRPALTFMQKENLKGSEKKLQDYMLRLQKDSGLNPEYNGWLSRGNENVRGFIIRATQSLQTQDKLKKQ